MNALDVVIKHRLWSVIKNSNLTDMDKVLEFYLYNNGKIDVIDEIKSNELLERYLEKFILNEYTYKYEKKMFSYLLNNLPSENFNKIMKKHSSDILSLQWIKRNQDKTPHFEFLNYIDKDFLENGKFLSYASKSSEKIIDFAIEINKSDQYYISDKVSINLLMSETIKGDLKIKLLSKFKSIIKENVMEYLLNNIKNEDSKVSFWILKTFSQEIKKSKDKIMNPLRCTYNQLMETILENNLDLFFDKKINFSDTLFMKVLDYKKEEYSFENALNQTYNQFKRWKITIEERESNSLFYKLVNYENIDNLLKPNEVLNINIKTISIDSILHKMIKAENEEDIELDKFKKILDKIYELNFKHIERTSNLLFLDYVQENNMDYLLSHPLFEYNREKLLHSMWTRDKELGIQLAHKTEKNIVWKYIDNLKKDEKIKFELMYYEEKFDNTIKEKKMKI